MLLAVFTRVTLLLRMNICVVLDEGRVASDDLIANVTFPRFLGKFGSTSFDLWLILMAVRRGTMIVEKDSSREFHLACGTWED